MLMAGEISSEVSISEADEPDVMLDLDTQPQSKRPRLLRSLRSIMRKRVDQLHKKGTPPKAAELQLDAYLTTTCQYFDIDTFDSFDFWLKARSSYNILAPLALDILTTPASSTSVEHTFSTAGEAPGRRNRLSTKNLEQEVLLKKNKRYYLDH